MANDNRLEMPPFGREGDELNLAEAERRSPPGPQRADFEKNATSWSET